LLSPDVYPRHLADVLSTVADEAFLQDLMKEHDWIEPKKMGAEG